MRNIVSVSVGSFDFLSCLPGHVDVVRLLLDAGSHIEHRNKAGCTPLMLAAREGHLETTRLLLDRGAKLDEASGSNEDTPLTLACWKGQYCCERMYQCFWRIDCFVLCRTS